MELKKQELLVALTNSSRSSTVPPDLYQSCHQDPIRHRPSLHRTHSHSQSAKQINR
jgi:hypothetical protein